MDFTLLVLLSHRSVDYALATLIWAFFAGFRFRFPALAAACSMIALTSP
jgi:hypothetical protein